MPYWCLTGTDTFTFYWDRRVTGAYWDMALTAWRLLGQTLSRGVHWSALGQTLSVRDRHVNTLVLAYWDRHFRVPFWGQKASVPVSAPKRLSLLAFLLAFQECVQCLENAWVAARNQICMGLQVRMPARGF